MIIPLYISKDRILNALELNYWYVAKAANHINVSRDIFTRIMKEYNIKPKRKLGENPSHQLIKNKSHSKFKRAYCIYNGIKKRCYNEKENCYYRYGGRGIKLSFDWLNDFDKFFDDLINLDHSFESGFEIDRIDNDGDYEKGNIRFVSHKINCNNTSKNRIIEIDGESKTLSEWSDEVGIHPKTIGDRIDKLGWDTKSAIFTLVKNKNND